MADYVSSMQHTIRQTLYSFVVALAFGVLLASGMLHPNKSSMYLLLPIIGLILCWLALELYRGVVRYWTSERSGEQTYSSLLGFGFALLAGCAFILQITGGLYSPFYPIFYLAVAFLASVGTSNQGAYWFAYALLLELSIIYVSMPDSNNAMARGALHIIFLSLFAGSHHLYLRSLLWNSHRLRNIRHPMSASEVSAKSQVRAIANVDNCDSEIHDIHKVFAEQSSNNEFRMLFQLLREGFDAHGCTLLWLDEEDSFYEVSHIDAQNSDYEFGPFPLHTGTPALIFRHQHQNTMRVSRSGDTNVYLPYYGRSISVFSWLAVPIYQQGKVRGALCLDRIHRTPFLARDESIFEAVGMIFSKMLEGQDSPNSLGRNFMQTAHFRDDFQNINQACSFTELANMTLKLVGSVVPYDWCMISKCDPDRENHTIIACTEKAENLLFRTMPLSQSLLSLALKHNCALPHKGMLRSPTPLISTKEPPLPEYASIFVIPLRIKHTSVGAMILASKDPQLFANSEYERALSIIAPHIASLFINIQHECDRELWCQQDNLTGLLNHRFLLDYLISRYLHSVSRNDRFTILKLDIDNFSEINKNYGYVTGDRVLLQISKTLKQCAREVDVIARYGYDQFVLVLDEVSAEGALRNADQLMSQIKGIEFCSEGHNPEIFSVTMSIGVATYPAATSDPLHLLMCADEALQLAKQRGGNRTALFYSASRGSKLERYPEMVHSVSEPPPGWGWASSASLSEPEQCNHIASPIHSTAISQTDYQKILALKVETKLNENDSQSAKNSTIELNQNTPQLNQQVNSLPCMPPDNNDHETQDAEQPSQCRNLSATPDMHADGPSHEDIANHTDGPSREDIANDANDISNQNKPISSSDSAYGFDSSPAIEPESELHNHLEPFADLPPLPDINIDDV